MGAGNRPICGANTGLRGLGLWKTRQARKKNEKAVNTGLTATPHCYYVNPCAGHVVIRAEMGSIPQSGREARRVTPEGSLVFLPTDR
jgi:hypothetical protein